MCGGGGVSVCGGGEYVCMCVCVCGGGGVSVCGGSEYMCVCACVCVVGVG